MSTMKLTICVWLVALGSVGVANAMFPQIECTNPGGGGLGGQNCGYAADALNKLDGVSGIDCGGEFPFLYVDPRIQTGPTCEGMASLLNKLHGVANISCDGYYGYFEVPNAAIPIRLTAVLQGPTCKHGFPISGPKGGENCTGSCDSGWQGSNCDSPVPRYVCNNSTYQCVPAKWPGNGTFLPSCLQTCIQPCHTGSCGAHQYCNTAKKCTCEIGWSGATCSVCDNKCHNHGTCPSTGVCKCDTGYGGGNCSTFLDPSPLFNETTIVTQKWGPLLNDWAKQPAGQKWVLCYSSATMGQNTYFFHEFCDKYHPTLTVAHNSLGRTFGGFNDETWHWDAGPYPTGDCKADAACCTGKTTCYKGTSACFLFELGPENGGPKRYGPIGTGTGYALAHPGRWPTWGSDGSDLNMGIEGDPGDLASCGGGTYAAHGGLCGTGDWGVTQIEVWRQV